MDLDEYRRQYKVPASGYAAYTFTITDWPRLAAWMEDNGVELRSNPVEVFGHKGGRTLLFVHENILCHAACENKDPGKLDLEVGGWWKDRDSDPDIMLHPSVLLAIPPAELDF